ncbi:MAG TPA: O-antigen ligase family protein [Candidatus Kapabacteria bacterium]|nr:O-antigen ligase family protein [Candidatus Kapabacteria bacterium]
MMQNSVVYTTSHPKLSLGQQAAIMGGSTVFFLVGQLFLPTWILLCLPIGVFGFIVVSRDPGRLLLTYLCSIIAVGIRMNKEVLKIGPLEAIVGFIMCFALAYIWHKKFVNKKDVINHNALYFLIAYTIWVGISGLLSIVDGRNTISDLFRDFLVFSPLIVLPILYPMASDHDSGLEKKMFCFLILAELAIVTVSGLLIRNGFLSAAYIYQTGTARYDIMNGAFMIFIFFALLLSEKRTKYQILYTIGTLLGVVSLVLTLDRTSWGAVLLCFPLLTIFAPKEQRQRGLKIIFSILILFILILILIIILKPIIWVWLQFTFSHFLTSANVKTDASLLGRFIEWRYVIKQILMTPITGIGFGANYWIYSWLHGYSFAWSYTHNGFLQLFLKGGVVGFLLMMTVFIKFFRIGVSISKSEKLSVIEQNMIRVGLVSMIFIAIQMLTLGIFIHRELLWYVGIIWGYFIVKYRKTKEPLDLPTMLPTRKLNQ